jgi:hypothetical protein
MCRLSGVCVFCQLDLAFHFTATSFLILLGMVLVGLWVFLHGVVTLAACCNMHVKLSIAICTSSCSFSLAAGFIVARTNDING